MSGWGDVGALLWTQSRAVPASTYLSSISLIMLRNTSKRKTSSDALPFGADIPVALLDLQDVSSTFISPLSVVLISLSGLLFSQEHWNIALWEWRLDGTVPSSTSTRHAKAFCLLLWWFFREIPPPKLEREPLQPWECDCEADTKTVTAFEIWWIMGSILCTIDVKETLTPEPKSLPVGSPLRGRDDVTVSHTCFHPNVRSKGYESSITNWPSYYGKNRRDRRLRLRFRSNALPGSFSFFILLLLLLLLRLSRSSFSPLSPSLPRLSSSSPPLSRFLSFRVKNFIAFFFFLLLSSRGSSIASSDSRARWLGTFITRVFLLLHNPKQK